MIYYLVQLELDTIMLIEFFDEYSLQKTIYLLIGLCCCVKRISTEFTSPRVEVDHCHILGTIAVMERILGFS